MTEPRSPISDHWELASGSALALALLTVVVTGCSGINVSKSISPLDFILPGLLHNGPASPVIPIETNAVPLLSQATPAPP